MSGVREPTDDVVESRIGSYETIIGVNPSASTLETEAQQLVDAPHETSEKRVVRTFTYVQRRQTLRHGEEWKRAENAVLALLSEVRKYEEGEE